MKKLTETTSEADASILRKTIQWQNKTGLGIQHRIDRVKKSPKRSKPYYQGAMKPILIWQMETTTALQPLKDRRDKKLPILAAKFKRLHVHPMKQRMQESRQGRLKRESFIHESKTIERQYDDIPDKNTIKIPCC
ncbi:hypothetical protein ElyMa_004515600 [Elysia marginata]|uniref:Uncharacterized protein n=1 Tax=Elysia marginata TaxID=1093978 RepID=A0AAV4HQJ0_9GAST|nr:hypothetical protein ElyMa_004515600 [Elysia marginata]